MNSGVQRYRLISRSVFFLLFLLAPVLDIFRLDLTLGHFIFFGYDWTLELAPAAGQSAASVFSQLFWRLALPVLLTVIVLIVFVWRWGRIYCGWLCPHFSVLEWLDSKMHYWLGRRSLWEKSSSGARPGSRTVLFFWILACSFLWAVSLLSYLIPPLPLWQGIFRLQVDTYPLIFMCAATVLFFIEFTLARHWFCRYGCAVGIFQSLIWAANPRGLVIGYRKERGKDCRDCHACDQVCPMRLPPRAHKQRKITCTQCRLCIDTCAEVQKHNPAGSLLYWASGDDARQYERQLPVIIAREQE